MNVSIGNATNKYASKFSIIVNFFESKPHQYDAIKTIEYSRRANSKRNEKRKMNTFLSPPEKLFKKDEVKTKTGNYHHLSPVRVSYVSSTLSLTDINNGKCFKRDMLVRIHHLFYRAKNSVRTVQSFAGRLCFI